VICQGSSTTLSANYTGFIGAGQQVFYQWTPTTGLSNPNIAQPLASPTSTIQYRVYAYSAGCTLTAVTSVIVNPSPLVQAGPDVRIAPSSSIRLQARISGGTAPIQFSWNPTTGLNNPATLDPLASPNVTTDYVLTVTSGNGCVRSDTIRVEVDSSITGRAISGRVLYDNAQLTPLSQATVILEYLGSAPAPASPPTPNSAAITSPNPNAGGREQTDPTRVEQQAADAGSLFRSGVIHALITNRRFRLISQFVNR